MFEFLEDKSFLNAVINKNHFYFAKQQMPTLKWEDFINEIDRSIKSNSVIRYGENFSINLREVHNISAIGYFLDRYSKIKPDYPASAHSYISLSSRSETLGRHNDPSDVLYWQVIGKTNWVVEDKQIHTYTLEENCLIYVPAKMWHDVTSLTPRVGVSLGIDILGD